jgi:SAM-dependent methyltransferase
MRAQGYGALPWVNDAEWFSALLPGEVLVDAPGVLDLGCGPARLGQWLRSRVAIPYVGVDRNPAMLDQAKGCGGAPPRVVAGDLETLTLPQFENWIFVIANVLHYLRDLDSLRSLPRRLGRPRLICLAQTESSDDATLDWARQLFAIVQPGYERLWHKAGDIDDCLERLGAEVVLDRVVCQAVDLDSWLDGWQVRRSTRLRAQAHFDTAPERVKAEGDGRLMVRRQRILHLHL